MKKFIPSFNNFITERELFTPVEKESWKFDSDQELDRATYKNYKTALRYAQNLLTNIGSYNSQQARIVIDRTARKFELTPNQKDVLEVDIFDWENQESEMNDNIVENRKAYDFIGYISRTI